MQGMAWYGSSEFWYTMNDVYGDGGAYDAAAFAATAKAFCARDWGDLMTEYRAGRYPLAKPDRFKLQCFKSAWMVAMLS